MVHDRARARVARIAGRRLGRVVQDLAETVVRQRLDSGVSQIALAGAAGVSRAYLCEIEAGRAAPSLDVLARLAAALGGEVSVRIYPGTGPIVRDHLQLAMAESLLDLTDRSWRPRLEVPVTAPTRGFADLVLHDPSRGQAVEVELHSQLRRVEQQLRWSQAKAGSLAVSLPPGTEMHRLLVLRSTEVTRHLVAVNQTLFATAFPASVRAVYAALRDPALRWPGDVLLWATVAGGRARILPTTPRGIRWDVECRRIVACLPGQWLPGGRVIRLHRRPRSPCASGSMAWSPGGCSPRASAPLVRPYRTNRR